MASSSRRTYSDLPFDVLLIICRKLSYINDLVVFGAVCTLWRSVVFQCHQHIPPVLMFLKDYSHDHDHDIRIFCLPGLSEHVLSTKENFHYCGSSQGWLIFKRRPYIDNELQLLNPFSTVNNVIQLPVSKVHPWKVVLSNDPLKTRDYVVVMIDWDCRLYFFKAGDTTWTSVDYGTNIQAVTHYRDQVFAIDYLGNLISCDINSTPPSVKKVASMIPCNTRDNSCLLELGVELIYVEWNYNLKFRVLKVEPREVLELNNLRGHAIFLSATSSVCVSASDSPNCKPDHIYFSVMGNTGAFNLIDKTIQTFLPNFTTITPVWIPPKLNMMKTTTKIEGHSHNSGYPTASLCVTWEKQRYPVCKRSLLFMKTNVT